MNSEAWKILIVNEKPESRGELGRLLAAGSGRGHAVVETASGADAVDLADCVDCLVAGDSLPDMAGVELLAALRRNDGVTRCPVVLVAENGSDQARQASLRAGAMEFLGKEGLTAEVLAHAVESAVARHRQEHPAASGRRADEPSFRALAEVAPVGLYRTDAEGRVIYVNSCWLKIVGINPGQALGDGWMEKLHPEDRGEVTEKWASAVRAGERVSAEYRLVRGEEETIWVHCEAVPEDGGAEAAPTGYVGAITDITERKQAEERQCESEWQLAMTLKAGQLGFWDWDVPSGQVFFGGLWATMLGYEPDELEPHLRTWERLVHPDDSERAHRMLTEHFGGLTEFYECEHRLRQKDGSWRWVLARGQVVARDAEGKTLRVLGTHNDITERKRSEERLRESEERFRLLVETSSQIVWETEPDGSIAEDSPSWRKFTGQSREDWLGNGWIKVIHPDDAEGLDAAWRAALRDATVLRRQFRIRRADGAWRWTQVVASPLRDPGGRLLKWVGMNTDVNEQKEAENRLRESESFYRQTLESIPGMTFTNTPQGDCDFMCQQWLEFTGMPLEENLGAGWTRALHPDDRAATYELWQASVAGGQDFETKYRVRRHDGVYKWFKVRGRAIRDSAGKIARWSGAAVNVDDLVRAEEALREADRHKDEFLAMLAHELRNPLAPILNAVQILRLTGQRGSPAGVHEVIERQVQHMVRLVDDLLDVSRVSSGRIQLRKSPLDLVAVVQHAVDTHRSAISARHHELALMLPAEPVRVDGDFIRLSQVVGNLLNNAAKYSDDGGKLYLSVEREDREGEAPLAVIRVRDTGRGIDPASMPRLFDLFYQVDRTIDRSDGGLGIGLSLVKSLVAMHDGTTEAHSAGRGHGSEFVVRLPALPEPAGEGKKMAGGEAPGVADAAAADAGDGKLRILVVDDNFDSAESMTLLLRLKGHDVRTAYDGEQAVTMALDDLPDVVLMDIGLPMLNGYGACRAMRDGGLDDALIVAMTGYGQDDDRRLSQEAGFDSHLVKPVDFAAVLELLERKVPA